jgi:hypothetical protein
MPVNYSQKREYIQIVEERAKRGVEKFSSIGTLETLTENMKLGVNELKLNFIVMV